MPSCFPTQLAGTVCSIHLRWLGGAREFVPPTDEDGVGSYTAEGVHEMSDARPTVGEHHDDVEANPALLPQVKPSANRVWPSRVVT
jgi:hypothetical protein